MQQMQYSGDIEFLDPSVSNPIFNQHEFINPFFVPYTGSDIKYTKTNILADDYKHVYILCLAVDYINDVHNISKINLFREPNTLNAELIAQSKLVTLLQAPFRIVNIHNIRNGLCIIGSELLRHFNLNCYQLNQKELVYCMLETREPIVKRWLESYNQGSLDQFVEQKVFTSYYKIDDDIASSYVLSLISRESDFKYWQESSNCKLTKDYKFANRKFNLHFKKGWNLPLDKIEKELEKLMTNFKENKTKYVNPGYPTEIIDTHKSSPKPNILVNTKDIKKDVRSYFELTKPSDLILQKEMIIELLVSHSLKEKEKLHLLSNLLISKKYCHYAFDRNVLEVNSSLFDKYRPLFRYLMGYAWVSLYTEESIKKRRTVESDRHIFDIETASKLPIFPYSSNTPYLNPYFTCMISDNLLINGQRIGGVKQSTEFSQGIVDFAELKKRLNVFTSGDPSVNILRGANWSNMVITGGCITAILPKTNPLMTLFMDKSILTGSTAFDYAKYDRFCQEYYDKSDIDIACNHDNILDYISHVKHLQSILTTNLKVNKSEIEIAPLKTLAIYINDEILKTKCSSGEIPFDYDYVKKNKNERIIKFYFYEKYLERKKVSNENNKLILNNRLGDDEYFEIINYCDMASTTLIINDYQLESEVIENRSPDSNSGLELVCYLKSGNDIFIKFSETLKYKITSKHLRHPLEVFRINGKEFFSCIAGFHLPCVRAYITETNCYMTPSAITSYLTLTNIDFNYFAGSCDPISIINKYRMRGFGIILNSLEIKQFLSYVIGTEHKKSYNIDNDDISKIIGDLDINHDLFKPLRNTPEKFVDSNIKPEYINIKTSYYESEQDIIAYYVKLYSKYPSDFVKTRTINSDGCINPVFPWYIDAAYSMLG